MLNEDKERLKLGFVTSQKNQVINLLPLDYTD